MATSPSKISPELLAQILGAPSDPNGGGGYGRAQMYTDPSTGRVFSAQADFGMSGTGDNSFANRDVLGPWRIEENLGDGNAMAYDSMGNPTGGFKYDNSWNDMIQAMALAAPAVAGIVGAAGSGGLGGGATAATGGTGLTAGTGSTIAGGSGLTAGSSAGYGTIAGGSGLTAGSSAGYGTIAGGSGLGGTGAGLSTVGSTIATPGLTAGTVGSALAGTGAATGTFSSGGGSSILDKAGNAGSSLLQNKDAIRAGVGLVGGLLSSNGGNSLADLSASNINPATLIPMLQSLYGSNWQQQLNASRYNINGPDGSSTWSQSPTFNQTGYDAAMKSYTDAQASGNTSLPAPTREQFTTNTWTNTSKLNPANQQLRDTTVANANTIAGALTNQQTKYADTVNTGANRSGIPNYQYTANTKDQQQQNPNSLPTYSNLSDTTTFQTPQYGKINAGPIQNNVTTTSRDWAGSIAPQVENYSSRLSERDPFSYYQQGADAAYSQATRYLLPKQQQDMQAMESRLGEQGFVPGTPAYDRALRQQLDSNATALADARDRAITSGQVAGNQAYTGETSALTGAMSGLTNLGTLGVNNDTSSFKQNLDAGNFANDAQRTGFDQGKVLSEQTRQTGLDANKVAQQLFDNTKTVADTNNVNATNTFNNLSRLTADNNNVISNNNKNAFNLADLNNKTVTDARTTANNDYTTDTNAQQRLVADMLGQVNKVNSGTTAPGPGISNVGNIQNADLAQIFQQFFGNNANIANAGTASNNANTAAFGQLLAAIIPGLFGGK